MEKRWVFKQADDQAAVQRLSKELNISEILAGLLVQRDISTFEEARAFFRPELDSLHDPFLMKDMDRAVERIERALGDGEKILVYGDYDVDGTTAVSLVHEFLAQFTDRLDYYIPDRYKEGYGISIAGIDFAKTNGFSLIIALDCGIKAIDKVSYANGKGIDFVICDHHRPGPELPEAYAVLDPKRRDCSYPFKELSGCGIGFKLAQALALRNGIPFDELVPMLDLLAVSIAADIVPIVGENRVLAHYGLRQINENPRKGIKAILDVARSGEHEHPPVNITNVVFMIAPRINAAGRMDSGKKAVELLISGDDEIVQKASAIIDEDNRTRRELDQQISSEALAMIEDDRGLQQAKSTVVYRPDWHKGVIGIVASRLIETYYRPTIVLAESNGKVSGSARSVRGFDVYEAISACSDLLEQFGGHMYAAGLTMKPENVAAFKARFEEVVSATIPDELLIAEVCIDAEIDLDLIDGKFVRILNQFAPFGPENMRPVFLTKQVRDLGDARTMGSEAEHLRMVVQQNGIKIPAIAFGQGRQYERIATGAPFDVVYSIEENTFKGNTTLQLNVKDLR